jgi:hypothetical protein
MSKLRILFVSANSIQGASLRVDAEFKAVKQQLKGKKSSDVPRYNPSATWEEVIDEIKGYRPHIVHFSAHGSPSEEIVLATEAGKPIPIPTEALEGLFGLMKGETRLVVMNSCFSTSQARAVAKFVDCVVGVKFRLFDNVALKFSPRFYEAIAEGESVAKAYQMAMVSVYPERPGKQQAPRLYKGRIRPEKLKLIPIKWVAAKPKPVATPIKGPDLHAAETADSAEAPSTDSISVPSCHSLHWDVRIDEEGDAYNEMAYSGTVLPRSRPFIFKLPAAEVQSGHTSQFELKEERTIVGAHLREVEISSTKVQMNVEFDNRPTAKKPGYFVLFCWDWNVYSMNLEEFRQKPHFSDTGNGVDYAQKFVPESWAAFTLVIQYPAQMVFAEPPYFEVYFPPESVEKGRNDELTERYQGGFRYSFALNQAQLSVERPESPFLYRISWKLGQSQSPVTSPLTPFQRDKQRKFANRLLDMRRTLETAGVEKSEAATLEVGVNTVLVSVAEHVHNLLDGAELDPETLEISLMVLDQKYKEKSPTNNAEYPVLRIAAGTLLQDPAYRELYFFVGDGNAGRAWKHRMARVYDLNESDPKRHIYKALPKSFRHRFLVSVPLIDPSSNALIYGILNLGTSSEEQAELLRKFGKAPGIEELTSHAQSYVLKRLKELINIT